MFINLDFLKNIVNIKKVSILKPKDNLNDIIKILEELPIDIDWVDDFELKVKSVESNVIYLEPSKGRISRIVFRGKFDYVINRISNNEPLVFNYNGKSFCIKYA